MLMLLARQDIHRYRSCFILQTTECLCLLDCDVDAVSETRHTPLQIMLIKERMECVYELFCYGADCNIGDSNGDTPLHWAVQVHQVYYLKYC